GEVLIAETRAAELRVYSSWSCEFLRVVALPNALQRNWCVFAGRLFITPTASGMVDVHDTVSGAHLDWFPLRASDGETVESRLVVVHNGYLYAVQCGTMFVHIFRGYVLGINAFVKRLNPFFVVRERACANCSLWIRQFSTVFRVVPDPLRSSE